VKAEMKRLTAAIVLKTTLGPLLSKKPLTVLVAMKMNSVFAKVIATNY